MDLEQVPLQGEGGTPVPEVQAVGSQWDASRGLLLILQQLLHSLQWS